MEKVDINRRSIRSLGVVAVVTAMATLGLMTASPASAQVVGSAQVAPGSAALFGVACPTATICEAVGLVATNPPQSQGVVVTITNGIPGPAQLVPGTASLTAVACPTATTCEAVGNTFDMNHGVVVTITNGAPAAPAVVSATTILLGISCQTTTTCEAAGHRRAARPNEPPASSGGQVTTVTNGIPGLLLDVPGSDTLAAIACRNSTTCEAVGIAGFNGTTFPGAAVTVTNGIPGPIQVGSIVFESVACGSATSCQLGGRTDDASDTGVVVPSNSGTLGTPKPVPTGAIPLALACPAAKTCEAAGAANQVGFLAPVTNGTPGTPQAVPGTVSLNGISCFSTSACVAVGFNNSNQGVVVTIGANRATITCTVTAVIAGPPKQQQVTVRSAAGLASISDITVVNGTVSVPPFTPGTTAPVVLTATKTDQAQGTTWHFVAHDILGNSHLCT